MEADKYQSQSLSLEALGDQWEAITPHDTNLLPRMYKYVINIAATDGTVTCISRASTDPTIAAATTAFPLKSGAILGVRPQIIKSTGTSNVTLIGII